MYFKLPSRLAGISMAIFLGLWQNASPVFAQFWEGQWIVNDPLTGAYLPYSPGAVKPRAISFIIDPGAHPGKSIQICAETGSSLLIENNLVGYFSQSNCHEFKLDSLGSQYLSDHIFFTIYNPNLNFSSNYRYTLITPGTIHELSRNDLKVIPIPRGNKDFRNFFVLGLVIILFFLAGLFRFRPRIFRTFYDLRSIFSLRSTTTELQTLRLFDRTNLMVLFLHSLLLAFVVIVVTSARQEWSEALPGFDTGSLLTNLGYWGSFTLGLFLFYIMKFGLIVQVSSLFGLREFRDQHFMDYLRLSMVFFLAFFVLLVLINLSTRIVNNEMVLLLTKSVSLFMIFRVIILFLKLKTNSTYRRMHLLSYLWVTEILPLVFILKLFV